MQPDHHDDVSDIASFYDRAIETEGSRLERHQLEYELTWRCLDRWLPLSGSILEVGSATGGYTLPLARKGYQLTAVDLSTALLAGCRQRVLEAGFQNQVRFVAADARNLAAVGDEDFDAVLVMGPLYHLVEEADRGAALSQAYKRLRPGGVIFTAWISRFGILGDLIKNVPAWITQTAEVRSVLNRGRDPEDYPRGGFRGYFARVNEIAPLHESAGFTTIALVGVEPGISADDESYNRLQDRERELWLDLLQEVSTEPTILGASRHLLYIGRKA